MWLRENPNGKKIPPHDIEAEESLLGALLLDGRLIGNIFNTIHEVDFYSERNSLIFTAISELYKRRNRKPDYSCPGTKSFELVGKMWWGILSGTPDFGLSNYFGY